MEVRQIQPLNRPLSPVASPSQIVMESPSHYDAPAVPINITALAERVVQLSQISALSSVPMSPNWVREDYIYDTVDVFPVFQVSPDDTKYLPATSPVTEIVLSSLIPPDPDCLPPGATGSFESILDCQSLIEQATDFSRLSPPLVPLPDDLILLPMTPPMPP